MFSVKCADLLYTTLKADLNRWNFYIEIFRDCHRFIMDGTILKIVETHKHLGVHLSSNNKWSKHIDSIIESASKQISYLRKIKYQFSKQTLNILYCTYIRPLLEYACEVWDGSTQADANR